MSIIAFVQVLTEPLNCTGGTQVETTAVDNRELESRFLSFAAKTPVVTFIKPLSTSSVLLVLISGKN